MKKSISIFALLLFALQVNAQEFLAPFDTFFSGQECYITTISGDVIIGQLRSATTSSGKIKSLSIKDLDGTKHKLKADKIKIMAIRPSDYARAETSIDQTTSWKKLSKADFREIMQREFLIYEQARLPKKKDKYALLQLINPEFDGVVKVYHNPSADQTMPIKIGGETIVGNEDRSYLVVKNDEKAVFVRKSGFSKDFAALFGDRPEFIKTIEGKPKFKDFAEHVFSYNSASSKTIK